LIEKSLSKKNDMPAKDTYHEIVKNALVKDGWTITHDPLKLKWGTKDMYVDLGAERLLAAEKGGQQIAVEIKSFVGLSEVNDLENAIGKYVVYHSVMARTEPNRVLYLAVHQEAFSDVFEDPLGKLLLEDYGVRLIVFDSQKEEILKWMP
jgi:hypothetical protein